MKEIEQIVNDYLIAENTDYAIMINGDWGCGKTYYIKNSLFKAISKIDSFYLDKNSKALKYEPLYVSLYGMTDMSDILYKIHLELNSWLKSKPWTVAKTGINKVVSYFGIGVTKEESSELLSIFSIKKNKVIFFDDLERIVGEKLSLSNVLGQINNFTEQENLKVIIICNSVETKGLFDKINEKTIRFTCQYKANLEDVFSEIISRYPIVYKQFLEQHKETIIKIFNIAEYQNLRTLRFILDIFQKIYNQTSRVQFHDVILKRFIFFTTIYSLEYKIGHKKVDLDSLENVGPYSKSLNFDFDNFSPIKQKVDKQPEKVYWQLFGEKYSEIIESYYHFHDIANYVHNGYLDNNKLSILIDGIISEIKRNEGTEEEKLIREIKNWKNLEDDDFLPLIEKVLKKIDECKFSLVAYPVIYAEFLQLEYYKVENFEITEDITTKFKHGIDMSKESHKYVELLRHKIPMWDYDDKTPAKDKYNEIYRYTLAANDYSLSKATDEISAKIIDSIVKNQDKELQETISNPTLIGSPIFEQLKEQEVFDSLLKAKKETISAFNWGLYYRYPENVTNTFSSFAKEKNFFCELQKLFEEYISKVEKVKITTVQLIELNRNLTRVKNLK